MGSALSELDPMPSGPARPPYAARLVRGGRRVLGGTDARRMLMLLVALGLLIGAFSGLSNGREVLPSNLLNIATSASLLGIVSVGEVVVMIAGGLDISIGSTAGLVSSVTAVVMVDSHESVVAGVFVGLAVGVAAGLVNGLMVAYVGVNSVIATLATYSAYAGLALLATSGQEIGIASNFFNVLGTGSGLGVPYLVWVLLVVCLIGIFVMRYTDIGRQIYAVGGSPRAALLAGIKVSRYTTMVFAVSGLCAAVAGVLLAAQTGSAQPTEGSVGLELTAITAILLGGIPLAGGSGSVLGAVLGVALLATLDNGLLLVGLQEFWQQVATGGLLVTAVVLQNYQLIIERVRGASRRFAT